MWNEMDSKFKANSNNDDDAVRIIRKSSKVVILRLIKEKPFTWERFLACLHSIILNYVWIGLWNRYSSIYDAIIFSDEENYYNRR
jgi:hypothetical protein